MAQPGVSTETAAPLPPQNLDAEETVLGALMLAGVGPILDDVVETGLRPQHFYRYGNGHVYRACLELRDRGEPVDALTVIDQLERTGKLAEVNVAGAYGADAIREIASIVPAASNAVHYARIVKDMAQLRHLVGVGTKIAQLGYDRPGDMPEVLAKAAELFATLDAETDPHARLRVETWHEFEQASHDRIPTIVDGLWPEAALGFIAAPPKKGKTWLGLDLAISVAAGVQFLGRFAVPTPQPVVYLALEGHRAAIRTRIGALARGHGLDPDEAESVLARNLKVVYKPRGLNLADPAWIRDVRAAANEHSARLLIVDVLRAAAAIKENDNDAFNAFRLGLDPIVQDGCSIALLHHFGKLTEISRDRTPGERMSGAGAMYGAFDVGIFITGADKEARELRLEFELRDLATPDPLGVRLTGTGTGDNRGFVYRDAAAWNVLEHAVDADDVKAPAAEIFDWICEHGGEAQSSEIRAAFGCSLPTLQSRHDRLVQLGVAIVKRAGKATIYRVETTEPEPADAVQEQLDLATQPVDNSHLTPEIDPRSATTEDFRGQATSVVEPHNHAELPDTTEHPESQTTSQVDLAQPCGFPHPETTDFPYGEDTTANASAIPTEDPDPDSEWRS